MSLFTPLQTLEGLFKPKDPSETKKKTTVARLNSTWRNMDRDTLVSARDVEGLVADGHLVVIYEDMLLRLDNWIDKHPGGRLSILHMVGRDATDEINVYHFEKTIKLMKAYRIGRVRLPWTNLEPPIRAGPDAYRNFSKTDNDTSADIKNATDAEVVIETATASSDSDDQADSTSIFSSGLSPGVPLSSRDSSVGPDDTEGDCKRRNAAAITTSKLAAGPEEASSCPINAKNLSREAYTAAMEKKEIADGIRDYPSLDNATQQSIRAEYDILHQRIKDQGLYNCPYTEYGKEVIRYSMLFGAFIYLVHIKWYLTSAVFLGLFWQQIMFTAHDGGHRGITGNFVVDTVIAAFIGDFCCGLSIGWWKSSHNVHHLITNLPEHDPDLQNIPLFSNTPTYFKSIHSTFYDFTFVWDKAADVLVPYQKYTYYPVMAIARFNLYILSWLHLLSPRATQLGSAWWTRWLEVVFMACYWALFGYALVWRTLPDWPTRVAFVLISHGITILLHVQITLSHWGMPTSDLGPTESFAQRQLRTTLDIDCPEWLDFFHGGLQFQAVHHLFPRLPRHNLRKAQGLVREFCENTGIRYNYKSFIDGNKVVLTRLDEVARMVETLVECHQHMAETGHYHLE
ncbi:Delta(8)-fatty-acid desaturase [Cytospora mali]|uniref:Delta 8-(E)-sphingolipid desaturase n=1 Tax=Cytospora mali TaxID=578113 RepID=A0A194VM55_CYTMA|nr:Delta(8)-fatty-acid desaturase [Valsa mali]